MSEILTESFCERCGTRYTFESARPKVRLKGVKVLSRGLKNFVLSDDTTMDEAMAAARSETDREVTAHQLDAFHKTFNFCMSCRQYTCPNCWNEVEARCQSCAPLAFPEIAPASFPGLLTLAETTVVAEPATNGANGHHDHMAADVSAAAEPEPVASQPEPLEVEPATRAEPATKAISQTAGLLNRFRPGQSLDDELAAFERERSDAEADAPVAAAQTPVAAADEPVEAAHPSVEAEAPVEAETPAIGELEPEPEPVSPVLAEPAPTAAAPADVVEQPTWRITAPDVEGPAATPAPFDAPRPSAEPQWPNRPEWPAPQASAGLPFLGRPAQPQGGVESLWAASNRELVATTPAQGRAAGGIQPCISCGLSLSATARFCRRCGTLQGG